MKKIKFIFHKIQNSDLKLIEPVPAQKTMPRWYHDGETFISSRMNDLNVIDKSERHAGMKSCMPLLDVLTSGYMLRTWRDVEITKNKSNDIEFRHVIKNDNDEWVEDKSNNPYIQIKDRPNELGYTMPRPQGHAFTQLVFDSPWGWQVPKGWSILVTHPFNRHDLPFTTISGFMESDKFTLNGGIPFFIKEGWTGVIEKGTVIAQLIPVKRESWMAYYYGEATKQSLKIAKVVRSVPYGWYRNNMWVKKIYKSERTDKK